MDLLKYDPFTRSRGCFHLDKVSGDDSVGGIDCTSISGGGGVTAGLTTYITFTVEEPLLLSPFLFGNPIKHHGFMGIQNRSLNLTLGSAYKGWLHLWFVRCWTSSWYRWNEHNYRCCHIS